MPQRIKRGHVEFVLLALAGCAAFVDCAKRTQETPQRVSVETHFDGCTDAIVKQLAAAKTQIHLQAYSFTSDKIARALTDADGRGVRVVVILDASNRTTNYSIADFLSYEGIETYIDSQHAIAHNKIIIIDSEEVLTGSFNFTKAAENNNAENLVVIRDIKTAAAFEKNWQSHFEHSEWYEGK